MSANHGAGCQCAQEGFLVDSSKCLYPFIVKDSVTALNEKQSHSVKHTIKPFTHRFDNFDLHCESEQQDPDLIVRIPLTNSCRITSLRVIGGSDGKSPRTVSLYNTNDYIDFSNIDDYKVSHKIDLAQDPCGMIPYTVKNFHNACTVILRFCDAFGSDQIDLHYLGLFGVVTGAKQTPVVTVYESQPNLSDHSVHEDLRNTNYLNF